MTTDNRLKTALLGSGAAMALLAGPAFAADEVTDLKAQIDALQNRLDSIESTQKKQSVERVAPAQAVTGGEFPGSWKLPGSDTSISFSGYVKADAMYTHSSHSQSISDSFVVSSIPLDGSVGDNQGGDFRLHARQSRVRFDSRTPTEWGSLRTRIEGDFFGANGNQRFSNSNSFRIRHAWGQLGPVLAGQTWTTFQDQDTFFDTVDFFGAAGQEFIRQAQIRYTAGLGKELSADLAIENPEQINARNVANAAVTNANFQDKMPDLIAALRWRPSWGAVNVSGVLRNFNYDDGAGAQDNAWGYGGHVGVTVKLWGKDYIGAVFNAGDGLGRYITGIGALDYTVGCSSGQGRTAMVAGCGADINTMTSWGGWASFTHYWTDTLRSNLIYGEGANQVDTSQLGNAGRGLTNSGRSVHVNLLWNPVSKVTIGLEYMHGWRTVAKTAGFATDTDGNAGRFQLGMQYNF
jgi:hypothetical protein